jgi:hypothetical protein
VGCGDDFESGEECAVDAVLAAIADGSVPIISGRCKGGSPKSDSSASRGVGLDADALMPDLLLLNTDRLAQALVSGLTHADVRCLNLVVATHQNCSMAKWVDVVG